MLSDFIKFFSGGVGALCYSLGLSSRLTCCWTRLESHQSHMLCCKNVASRMHSIVVRLHVHIYKSLNWYNGQERFTQGLLVYIPKEVPSSQTIVFLWWFLSIYVDHSWITLYIAPQPVGTLCRLGLGLSKGRQWNAKPEGPSLVCSDYHSKEQTEGWSDWHASVYIDRSFVDEILPRSSLYMFKLQTWECFWVWKKCSVEKTI